MNNIFPKNPAKTPRLPYAVGNFEQLRQNDEFFFVDKTHFIRELEEYQVPVYLRPRRFGKTMWCSTLECYYDINRKSKFEALFGDLEIGQNPTGLQNQFMVLRLNFSTIQVKFDMDVLEKNFNDNVQGRIDSFLMAYQSYFQDKIHIPKDLIVSKKLEMICEAIQKFNLPPLYLIIDEYDNFINQLVTSHQDHLYKEITTGDSFFRTFFKVVKAGVESLSIGKVYITGVLPMTIDDLTSGFNIAQVVTLQSNLHGMLGFTENEVAAYLGEVVRQNNLSQVNQSLTLDVMRQYYNGYKFVVSATDTLYNSTIATYFLQNFAFSKGETPNDLIDPNVKTDVSWFKRLTSGEDKALALATHLINEQCIEYNVRQMSDRFSMERFFDQNHYLSSLFYLGLLTIEDEFTLKIPNQTLHQIFLEYYNDLSGINTNMGYTQYFRQFLKDQNMQSVFQGYWNTYISQIPAQAFDKMNENFFRLTFFEIFSRYLCTKFTFGVEVNYPSGRSDWEMTGRPETVFKDQKWIVEFKYFKKSVPMDSIDLDQSDVNQVYAYKADSLKQFPEHNVRTSVVYVFGNFGFKWWDV